MIEPRRARDIVFPSLLIFFNQESKSQPRNRKNTHTHIEHMTHTYIHTDDATGDRVPNCVLFFLAFLSTLSTNPTHHHVANSFNFIFSKNSFCCFLNVWNIVSIWFNVVSFMKQCNFFDRDFHLYKKDALNRMPQLRGCALNRVYTVFPGTISLLVSMAI